MISPEMDVGNLPHVEVPEVINKLVKIGEIGLGLLVIYAIAKFGFRKMTEGGEKG